MNRRPGLTSQATAEDIAPEGYEHRSRDSLAQAAVRVLAALYAGQPRPDAPASSLIPEKRARNLALVRRYLAGEAVADLAHEFGISVRRVNRLIRRYLDRGEA